MAKRFYCTLFDSFYLPRGLAMLESLAKHDPDSHTYVFAFDENSRQVLQSRQLPITVVSLQEFETPDLLAVKSQRTKGEYCWTCTPAILWHCLEKYSLPSCTYLDADLMFYASPEDLLEEARNADVMITEHRYSPQNAFLEGLSGKYCVQFVHFKNTPNGLGILGWWRYRCIEWCYARHEDGKFGDQKYLDDWKTRFRFVHVLRHLGGGVAPWNVDQYRFSKTGDDQIICHHEPTNQDWPLVFYHFHGVQLFKNETVSLGSYQFRGDALDLLYRPYLRDIAREEAALKSANVNYQPPRLPSPTGLSQTLREIKRRFTNRNRRYSIAAFRGT